MVVKSFSGHRTPSNAKHFLGQITLQRHSGTSYETWYSTDGSIEDQEAFLAASVTNTKALNSKEEDNYPIWR